jgi:oligoribonuclease NrnB/cAMP/cGMP phosphodiesterase (DHH superfamily)
MASRRKFKKQIKNRTNLLIEDAFIESINGDAREAVKMDSIIDEVIDTQIVKVELTLKRTLTKLVLNYKKELQLMKRKLVE